VSKSRKKRRKRKRSAGADPMAQFRTDMERFRKDMAIFGDKMRNAARSETPPLAMPAIPTMPAMPQMPSMPDNVQWSVGTPLLDSDALGEVLKKAIKFGMSKPKEQDKEAEAPEPVVDEHDTAVPPPFKPKIGDRVLNVRWDATERVPGGWSYSAGEDKDKKKFALPSPWTWGTVVGVREHGAWRFEGKLNPRDSDGIIAHSKHDLLVVDGEPTDESMCVSADSRAVEWLLDGRTATKLKNGRIKVQGPDEAPHDKPDHESEPHGLKRGSQLIVLAGVGWGLYKFVTWCMAF